VTSPHDWPDDNTQKYISGHSHEYLCLSLMTSEGVVLEEIGISVTFVTPIVIFIAFLEEQNHFDILCQLCENS
jgi:TRAP-type uncharacterized transport system fused permease subunit